MNSPQIEAPIRLPGSIVPPEGNILPHWAPFGTTDFHGPEDITLTSTKKRTALKRDARNHPLLLPALTLATASVLVMLLIYVLVTGQKITDRYLPLLDDITQVSQEATTAWLEFVAATTEEPTHPNRQFLWESLHRAAIYIGMLHAARLESNKAHLHTGADPLEADLQSLHSLLNSMVKASTRNVLSAEGKASASDALAEFTRLYQSLLITSQSVERKLLTSLNAELTHYRQHSLVLLGFVLLLASALILLLRAILKNDRLQMAELRRATREIRRKNLLLEQLAYFDHLTGLPNQPLFRDRSRQAILHAQREGYALVFLYLDLDGFKGVNDQFGHETGDHLLVETAKRISRSIRKEDTVSRLSGDEFAIMLANIPDIETAEETSRIIAEKILSQLQNPFDIDGQRITVSASIGISLYPQDGADGQHLLKAADNAMYLAKANGKNTFQYFSPRGPGDPVICEQELQHQLDSDVLELHYQPQWQLASGRLAGLEVLIRSHDSDGKLLSPARLLPMAERSTLVTKLDLWVIEHACRDFSRWLKTDSHPPKLALNISPQSLKQGRFATRFIAILQKHQIPASRIEIEIAASTLMSLSTAELKLLDPMLSRGIHLAVNCQGARYEMLDLLARLPISALKIDQEFTRNAAIDPLVGRMFDHSLDIARRLGVTTIAEGIEDASQLEWVKIHGCETGQGFFLGAPARGAKIERLFTQASLFDKVSPHEDEHRLLSFPPTR